jgi:hypothetical protein
MVEKPKLEIANEPAAAPDPLNVAALRLPPAFEETAGVRKQLTIVPVRKPHRQEWIRVHPDEAYRGDFRHHPPQAERRILPGGADADRDAAQRAHAGHALHHDQ